MKSRLVPIFPSGWHHVSISTTPPLHQTKDTAMTNMNSKTSLTIGKVNIPSWVSVYLNMHACSHPYEMKLSHGGSCCKSICWESNTLGMVAPHFLHHRVHLYHQNSKRVQYFPKQGYYKRKNLFHVNMQLNNSFRLIPRLVSMHKIEHRKMTWKHGSTLK